MTIHDIGSYVELGAQAPEPDDDWCWCAVPCDCDEPLWDETDEPDGPQGREYRDGVTR